MVMRRALKPAASKKFFVSRARPGRALRRPLLCSPWLRAKRSVSRAWPSRPRPPRIRVRRKGSVDHSERRLSDQLRPGQSRDRRPPRPPARPPRSGGGRTEGAGQSARTKERFRQKPGLAPGEQGPAPHTRDLFERSDAKSGAQASASSVTTAGSDALHHAARLPVHCSGTSQGLSSDGSPERSCSTRLRMVARWRLERSWDSDLEQLLASRGRPEASRPGTQERVS